MASEFMRRPQQMMSQTMIEILDVQGEAAELMPGWITDLVECFQQSYIASATGRES